MENMKTLALVNNNHRDPLLNINAAFFSEKPSSNYMHNDNPLFKLENFGGQAFNKDMIYRKEFDHPMSFNNQSLTN